MIEIKDLNVKIDYKDILKNINLRIPQNKITGILGANGSGKSTLLKCIYSKSIHWTGEINLKEKSISKYSTKELGKIISIVPQENKMFFDFTVDELMQMSRYIHHRFLENTNKNDKEICAAALKDMGVFHLLKRSFQHLSGGEKQRVLLAMALAKESQMIILDEPTNHLDISHQITIMKKLKELKGKTVITTVHDLNLAYSFCDHIILLKNGEVNSVGNANQILSRENIMNVFRVDTTKVELNKNKEYICLEME